MKYRKFRIPTLTYETYKDPTRYSKRVGEILAVEASLKFEGLE